MHIREIASSLYTETFGAMSVEYCQIFVPYFSITTFYDVRSYEFDYKT